MTITWHAKNSAPKDGQHILVCNGSFRNLIGFNQRPPVVVHYWDNAGEEGFYLSQGIVEGSYNDCPVEFTHWADLKDQEPSA